MGTCDSGPMLTVDPLGALHPCPLSVGQNCFIHHSLRPSLGPLTLEMACWLPLIMVLLALFPLSLSGIQQFSGVSHAQVGGH